MKQDSNRINTRIGTFTVNELGIVISFNGVLSALFEYPSQEIIGQPASLLIHEFRHVKPTATDHEQPQVDFLSVGSGCELLAYKKMACAFQSGSPSANCRLVLNIPMSARCWI